MKDQYIGDIGDYGKYGLLRFLAAQGTSIGVNWYLTPADGRTDGSHTEYLHDDRMRVYDVKLYDSMAKILNDIRDTVDALTAGRETGYTLKLREKRGWATYQLLYARDLGEEQIKEYNDNRPTRDDTEVELIIDFFQRFLYRMEYMMRVGKEKGYDLISFMGP